MTANCCRRMRQTPKQFSNNYSKKPKMAMFTQIHLTFCYTQVILLTEKAIKQTQRKQIKKYRYITVTTESRESNATVIQQNTIKKE